MSREQLEQRLQELENKIGANTIIVSEVKKNLNLVFLAHTFQ